jgi:protein phosphatase PTC7
MAFSVRGFALAAHAPRSLVRSKRSICTSAVIESIRNHSSLSATTSFSRRAPWRQTSTCQTPFRQFSTTKPFYSTPKFTYGISASYCSKENHYDPVKNVSQFNAYNAIAAPLKPPQQRPASGQDSYFVAPVSQTSDIALGIADGVGGWIDSGVDPSDFSHGFCEYMAYTAYTSNTIDSAPISARRLMQRGYDLICKSGKVRAGGSTACIGLLSSSGSMEVANLGDSGFVQLRLNAVHAASEFQTHAFNTPYQLSLVPESVIKQARKFGGEQLMDFPADADVMGCELRHGDVVVFASDGVWDNLSSGDLLKIVSRGMREHGAWVKGDEGEGIAVGEGLSGLVEKGEGEEDVMNLQSALAVGIAAEAKAASVSLRRDGPFAREVQRRYPEEDWRGGKADDICLVVVVVVEEGK